MYAEELDTALRTFDPTVRFSPYRQAWLGFCLVAIVVTHTEREHGQWTESRAAPAKYKGENELRYLAAADLS